MPSISNEDYIKAIYGITKNNGKNVTTSVLADKLNVSSAAISEMARKLADNGYISYAKYKGMELTRKGEKLALKVIRRHRLWELFLIKSLGLSWSEVHDEAEKFEHHTSEFLIDKIDEFLEYPKFDPHGDPIPSKDGVMPELPAQMPLSEAKEGVTYRVIRVNDESSELMEYFTKLGVQLQKKIKVLGKLSFDNSVFIQINGNKHSLSEMVADKLSVAPVKEEK